MSAMLFLRQDELIDIHNKLIEEFGGTHGLRDEGALESALTAVSLPRFLYVLPLMLII